MGKYEKTIDKCATIVCKEDIKHTSILHDNNYFMKRKDFLAGYHQRLEKDIRNYGAFTLYLRYITLTQRVEVEALRRKAPSPFQIIYDAILIPEWKEIDGKDLESLMMLAETTILRYSFAQMLFWNQIDFHKLTPQQKSLLQEYASLIHFMRDSLKGYIEELQSDTREYAA